MSENQMTIPDQLTAIGEKICDSYCKYPGVVHEKWLRDEIASEDEKYNYLIEHYCEACPLSKLF